MQRSLSRLAADVHWASARICAIYLSKKRTNERLCLVECLVKRIEEYHSEEGVRMI